MTDLYVGSTCLCRPLYKVPADADESSQSNSASVPSVASPVSGKVQKPGKRQSHMQAAPENIAKALEAMPDSPEQEEDVSDNSAPLPSHHTGPDVSHSLNHRNEAPTVSMSSQSSQNPAPTAAGSNCCSQKSQPPAVASNGGGSCCSGKPVTPLAANAHSDNSTTLKAQPTAWNDMSYMNFATPQMPTWQNQMANQARLMQPMGIHNGQSQSNYMGNYALNVSSAQYGNMMNQLGISQPALPPFASNHSQTPGYTPTTLGSDPCHDCKCGEECQCLGCAAHPFNNTTRQHVQEMGVLMTFDGDEHTPEAIANAYQSPPFHAGTATTPLNYFMQHGSSIDNSVPQNTYDPYSDPNSAMPSGYSSPLRPGQPLNQQLMHPSEYYTLEYPVGIPSACSDVTGSCQCGNDCSCVGCLTHSGHNGMPLEAPIPESSIATTVEQQPSSHGPTPTTSAGHTSRIPVLENVSMPCLSPRTLETSMI